MIKQYPMRVEEQIWRQAKARAALDGVTMREAIERLLIAWAKGEFDTDKKKE